MTAVVFALLLAFWIFVGWRVRVEKGRVLSPMRALTLGIRHLERIIGTALAPVFAEATRQALAFGEAFGRVLAFGEAFGASVEQVEAEFARALKLPDDFVVTYDTRDLIDPDSEGGTSE